MSKEGKADFELVEMDPPIRKFSDTSELMENIEAVGIRANGKWHRIAMYEKPFSARNRVQTLKKREDLVRYEFKSTAVDDEPGFTCAVWCRWRGVVRRQRAEEPVAPRLTVVDES